MIQPLTWFDEALCEVASDIATRFFPKLGRTWHVGVLSHQPVAASARLFCDRWPVGRIDAVELPGGEVLFAEVDDDYGATVQAHNVTTNAGGVCLRARRVILICARRFDLRGVGVRALLVHEIAHATTPAFPLHGPAWRACVEAKARRARLSGDDALADLLLADAARHAAADFPYQGPQDVGTYLDAFVAQSEAARARVRIAVGAANGPALDEWLASRKAAHCATAK